MYLFVSAFTFNYSHACIHTYMCTESIRTNVNPSVRFQRLHSNEVATVRFIGHIYTIVSYQEKSSETNNKHQLLFACMIES